MVTLMLPFQLLTGMDLPARAAGIVFVYAGFLAGAGIWLLIHRRAGQVCLALTSATMILAVTARVASLAHRAWCMPACQHEPRVHLPTTRLMCWVCFHPPWNDRQHRVGPARRRWNPARYV